MDDYKGCLGLIAIIAFLALIEFIFNSALMFVFSHTKEVGVFILFLVIIGGIFSENKVDYFGSTLKILGSIILLIVGFFIVGYVWSLISNFLTSELFESIFRVVLILAISVSIIAAVYSLYKKL